MDVTVERIDGCGVNQTKVDIRVNEIASLRVDEVRYVGTYVYGEIVMRSGFKHVLSAKAGDWETLRKLLYQSQ
jgi:hypothetical protein